MLNMSVARHPLRVDVNWRQLVREVETEPVLFISINIPGGLD